MRRRNRLSSARRFRGLGNCFLRHCQRSSDAMFSCGRFESGAVERPCSLYPAESRLETNLRRSLEGAPIAFPYGVRWLDTALRWKAVSSYRTPRGSALTRYAMIVSSPNAKACSQRCERRAQDDQTTRFRDDSRLALFPEHGGCRAHGEETRHESLAEQRCCRTELRRWQVEYLHCRRR